MKEVKLNIRDGIVEQVVNEFVKRSDFGFKKYGVTLEQEREKGVKNLDDYMRDVQEELMDAVLYIQSVREELKDSMAFIEQVKQVKKAKYDGHVETILAEGNK